MPNGRVAQLVDLGDQLAGFTAALTAGRSAQRLSGRRQSVIASLVFVIDARDCAPHWDRAGARGALRRSLHLNPQAEVSFMPSGERISAQRPGPNQEIAGRLRISHFP